MPGSRAAQTTPAVGRGFRPIGRRDLGGLAVAAVILGSAAIGAPLGASTTAGLRAEAAQVSAEVEADNANLAAIGERYLAAVAAYHADERAVAEGAVELESVQATVAGQQLLLQRAAVSAYVGAGSTSSIGLYLVDRPDELTSTETYLNVADGKVESSITALSIDERRLTLSVAAERRATQAARTELAEATSERSHAVSTLFSEERTLRAVQGHLAALVAAETAAAERAAAARAAAAAQAEAAAAAAAASSNGSTASAGASAAGPPSVTSTPTATGEQAPPSTLAGDFAAIRNCESSGDYSLDTGNGYYGAYQFSAATWVGLGESGLPSEAPPAVQDAAAYRLYQSSGWAAWPSCAAIAGLG